MTGMDCAGMTEKGLMDHGDRPIKLAYKPKKHASNALPVSCFKHLVLYGMLFL